ARASPGPCACGEACRRATSGAKSQETRERLAKRRSIAGSAVRPDHQASFSFTIRRRRSIRAPSVSEGFGRDPSLTLGALMGQPQTDQVSVEEHELIGIEQHAAGVAQTMLPGVLL